MSHGARPLYCVHELILEHPNFQRRKMISRTDPVIPTDKKPPKNLEVSRKVSIFANDMKREAIVTGTGT
jgi:hypothetical protein